MRRAALVVALWGLAAVPSEAQVTISSGLSWAAGHDAGDSTATLRSNAIGATVPPFTWFEVDSRATRAFGFEVKVGVDLTDSIAIEGGVSYARPRLAFTISRDSETASQEFEGETLHQYLFDGGIIWRLPVRQAPRVVPFISAGAGYLRQLHEERTLVESGEVYYAGGGVRYWLTGNASSSRSIGIRGDVRLNIRRHGIDFENTVRVYPTVAALLFFGL